ncbi:hypothetical protein M501DRAFT_718651 [Patellaria atrata CBS 101060]|uniref:Protein kinase domain-containing protein n=1 Tax=Patellaria atrata CBS 101060 TaxID=1346257 RepID=A0A9P4SBC8_9PEZI|nr:hypothetical protein M501DRAFT_718651 [Patellaria atrata CBS 101060]
MDPVSLAVGIVGLYSACRDCFIFFSDVRSAETNAFRAIRALGIQESILKSWGAYWGIHRHKTSFTESGRLQLDAQNKKIGEYLLHNRYKIDGIEGALCAIADLLSNHEKLHYDYGIELKPDQGIQLGRTSRNLLSPSSSFKDQVAALQDKSATLRQRFSILRRCKWSLRDGNKVIELTKEISKHNHTLSVLCPDGAYETLRMNFLVDYLWSHVSPAGLIMTKTLATQMSSESNPESSDLYEILADLAPLKGLAVHSAGHMDGIQRRKLLALCADDYHLLRSKTLPVLALWSTSNHGKWSEELVLIEYKSYHDENGHMDEEIYDDILKFGKLLTDERASNRLRTLKCYGMFDEPETGKIGFVYELPGHLGIQDIRDNDDEDLKERRPVNLATILNSGTTRPLGWRFELAKKILNSVLLLHAAGWVHKNIRPKAIIFFPKDDYPIDRGDVDWESPFIAEWGLSRSDRLYDIDSTAPAARVQRAGRGDQLDFYHHPDKRRNPDRRYLQAYDIYSLGLTLLEIGMWRSLPVMLEKIADGRPIERAPPEWILNTIIKEICPQLVSRCGEIYAFVVEACLTVKTKETDHERKVQAEKCALLAAQLSKCRA